MEYLAVRDLLELIQKVNWADPGYRDIHIAQELFLTRTGLDCAESGMTVSEFLHPRPMSRGDTYHATVQSGAQGTQIGRQNTMNNSWGPDPNALLHLAKDVLTQIPELGLDETAEAELGAEATALRDEASAQQPDPTVLRRAYDAVMGALERAPETMAGQWLHEAGTAAINSTLGG